MPPAWIILSVIAGIGLLASFRKSDNASGQSVVWGGATLGLISGLIAAAFYAFTGHGFEWLTIWKWVVVAVLASMCLDGLSSIAGARR